MFTQHTTSSGEETGSSSKETNLSGLPRRRVLQTTGSVLSASMLAGCNALLEGSSDEESGPFVIGADLALSQGFSLVGGGMVNAAKLAAEEINNNGGVDGRDIEFVVEDNEASGETAVSKANKLIDQDEVDLLFGPINSFTRIAMSPVAQENEVPLLYPISYEGIEADDYCTEYLFKSWLVPQQQVIPLIPWLMDEYDVNSFYMLGSDYSWPRSLNTVVRSAVEENGGEVVGEEYVQLGTTDFTSILTQIESTGPDALIMDIVGGSVPAIQQQMNDRGLREEWLEVGLGHAPDVITGIPPEAVEGVLMNRGYFKAIDTERNNEFVQEYQDTYDDDTIVSPTTGPAYVAIKLLEAAVEEAGGTTTEDLMAGFPEASVSSIAGEVSFGHDHQVRAGSYVAEIGGDRTGEIIHSFDPVMPPEQCSEF
jgi:urea transport system substrate-binding protein